MDASGRTGCIRGLLFNMMSPYEIIRQSVVNVTQTTLYDKGLPHQNGPMDHRMGTVDHRYPCGTCGQDIESCPGHTGHIELVAPVYHPGFLSIVIKVLRVVCYFCSQCVIGIHSTDAKMRNILETTQYEQRLNALTELHKPHKQCPHCKGYNPKYSQVGLRIVADWSIVRDKLDETTSDQVTSWTFTAHDAWSILNSITPSDAAALGFNPDFNMPSDLIVSVMLVPPIAIRPVVMQSESSRARSQDDLTKRIQEIIKANNNLAKILSASGKMPGMLTGMQRLVSEGSDGILVAHEKLQYLYGTYIQPNCKGIPASMGRGGAPIKSIRDRVSGKTGRIRQDGMGKRVNCTARTVIGPMDNAYDVDEVCIPEYVAMTLTKPMVVNRMNRGILKNRVVLGPSHPRGAKTVQISPSSLVTLSVLTTEQRQLMYLPDGAVVNVPLETGDHVIMNRQPTLHRHSMMSHKIVVESGSSTFKLHSAAVKPYNADFDGDEMNLHAPQTYEAQAEVREIMSVQENCMSHKDNSPVIGLIQDTVLGVYYLTRRDTFLTREFAMQLAMHIKYPECTDRHPGMFRLPEPAILKPVPMWTGKQLISAMLPRGLCMSKVVRGGLVPDDDHVLIVDGQLVRGTLCNQTVGPVNNGIGHVIVKDYSKRHMIMFVSDCKRVADSYLRHTGASIGLKDCVPPTTVQKGVSGVVDRMHMKLSALDAHLEAGEVLDATPNDIEGARTSIVCQVLDLSGRIIMSTIDPQNRFKALVDSGAKGKMINITQVMGIVGQQRVNGARLWPKTRDDDAHSRKTDPTTLGFIKNSYYSGVTPDEFFACAVGGREGLTDTAVKTANIGYTQRKLELGCSGLCVYVDGTVRTPQGDIVLYAYGGDGFDASMLEKISNVWTITAGDAQIRSKFTRHESDMVILLRDAVRDSRLHNRTNLEISSTVFTPIHLERLIQRSRFATKPAYPQEHTQEHVENTVDNLCEWVTQNMYTYVCTPHALLLLIRTYLNFHDLVEHGVTRPQLDYIVDTIKRAILKCRITPGDVVGSIAAQSIGEPSTQMTLNTFHTSGVGSSISLGVPRLVELINCSKRPLTPSMTIQLIDGLHPDTVEFVRRSLVHITLSDVVTRHEIISRDLFVPNDATMITIAEGLHAPPKTSGESRHVIRLVLDKSKLTAYNVLPSDVARCIRNKISGVYSLIHSGVVSDEWVIRIHLNDVMRMSQRISQDVQDQTVADLNICHHVTKKILSTVEICGIPGITAAHVSKVNRSVVDQDTREIKHIATHIITTSGCSVMDASLIVGVDPTTITTNRVDEVRRLFGIEAAAHALYREIAQVMQSDGGYVDYRHMVLVADAMTSCGVVIPMTRFGVSRARAGVISNASFEETFRIMAHAAMFNKFDPLRGVNESVFIGNISKIGTGSVHIVNTDGQASCVPGASRHKTRTIYRSVITSWSELATTPLTAEVPAPPPHRAIERPATTAASVPAPPNMMECIQHFSGTDIPMPPGTAPPMPQCDAYRPSTPDMTMYATEDNDNTHVIGAYSLADLSELHSMLAPKPSGIVNNIVLT